MAPWGLVAILIGVAYGALKRGRQDKGALFRQGVWIGVVVGLAFAIIGLVLGAPTFGVLGFLGLLVDAIVLSLLFILGVWIGDLITGARRQTV